MLHTPGGATVLRLISRNYPALKLYIPASRRYARFEGGILDLDESDPDFEAIKKRAIARPDIEIRNFDRTTAAGRPDSSEVKAAADFICNACNPPQPFDSEAELAAHTAALHTARPILGDEGQDTPQTDAKPTPPVRVRQGTVTSRGSRGTRRK
jgi:hypothetical protein